MIPVVQKQSLRSRTLATLVIGLGSVTSGLSHVSYPTGGSRDFGTLVPGGPAISLATNPTVSGDHGWADGTDADFGDSHKVRGLRFTLSAPATITLTINAVTSGFLPGYSIYSGLAHLAPITAAPGSADYDTSAISLDYLGTLGGVAKEGAFTALTTWRMGGDNQTGPVFNYNAIDGLSTFTYMGHAVDGTAANYGSAPGIVGDGNADGNVSGTFSLPAGDYSIFVGGANYAATNPATTYTFGASIVAVPEPASLVGLLMGATVLLRRRR